MQVKNTQVFLLQITNKSQIKHKTYMIHKKQRKRQNTQGLLQKTTNNQNQIICILLSNMKYIMHSIYKRCKSN